MLIVLNVNRTVTIEDEGFNWINKVSSVNESGWRSRGLNGTRAGHSRSECVYSFEPVIGMPRCESSIVSSQKRWSQRNACGGRRRGGRDERRGGRSSSSSNYSSSESQHFRLLCSLYFFWFDLSIGCWSPVVSWMKIVWLTRHWELGFGRTTLIPYPTCLVDW